jgi:2-polyprenyl-3-methyl-5-hydroxy-6-metoxy-1,4-benzoquinol methylase
MVAPQLSRQEAIQYWDARHRAEGDLRSGGHIGWDAQANEAFYLRRAALLLKLIGDRVGRSDPLFALDAGCGKGEFARILTRCGLVVDGIDASPEAIAFCQRQGGGGRFMVSTLADHRQPFLYDVVYSVDVLFHILEDDDWERSLRNLASLVRLAGRLIVADEDRATPRAAGNYIVHRPRTAYTSVLEPLGFVFESFTPYEFRENAVGLLSFARTR